VTVDGGGSAIGVECGDDLFLLSFEDAAKVECDEVAFRPCCCDASQTALGGRGWSMAGDYRSVTDRYSRPTIRNPLRRLN
jgi:hypothetical protein